MRLMVDLLGAVEGLRRHVRTMGCTCATNEQEEREHVRGTRSHCAGVGIAAAYDAVVARARKRLNVPAESGGTDG